MVGNGSNKIITQAPAVTRHTMVKFESGAHSETEFAEGFCGPLFASGVITEYPGADFYAICYGELCAYSYKRDQHGHHTLLAVHSANFPDCKEDIEENVDYTGTWRAYTDLE